MADRIPPPDTHTRAKQLRQQMTVPERKLWSVLRSQRLAGLKFRRQHPIEPYIVDFYCDAARLVVEVDGESHAVTGDYDIKRQRIIENRGYTFLRVSNDEVLEDVEAVALGIARAAGVDLQKWLSGG
ncbi:hypothetical protein Pan258_42700 [Symmachiella dynata]|uniref:endonuclease domain-containing protein n=1 Tax=Symmachiella dynata TaxID=2527995 RepID=UPI0011897859|nr:DUF559 domain-containing protein [Symmachiella dynata]QDT50213.1 hypothetical protein Pan258_42700 [Symmachiella dynata]